MNIRPKVMILMTLVFMALSAGAFLIQERVLMPSFARLERANAQTAIHRVRHAVDRTLESLEVNAMDWSNWGDVYRFVADHNADFIRTNVTRSSLNQLQINTMLIVDGDGRIVMSSSDHVRTSLELDGVLLDGPMLRSDFRWRRFLGTRRTAHGLVRTNLGVLMIAGAPILDGTGGGPPRGMVILGRLLTPALVRRMEAQTETSISLVGSGAPSVGDRIVDTDTTTQIYGGFSDVFGQPALTLRVDVPRDVTAYGHRAIMVATGSLIAAALVTFLLLAALLNRYVLRPLTQLTQHAVAVAENPEITQRLDLREADEFGKLAREFDSMVKRLAQTRRELVDQSFQAGFAEMAKGVLHNLGNALTPLGVRLSAMERRMRESPAADLELAVRELAAGEADPVRRAALLEFLSLGCREMSGAVQETASDIELLQRQASLMRASLSDQLRGSHQQAPVLETVSLPELVSQSLDIVPDSSRRRLQLEIDPSVRQVGAVRLARTVLRMVLQNLIINAADAVRDAGKDTGVLRFRAELVHEGGRDSLHLQCQDDGQGIAPDKLEKVFEKGYSTKSRDTNQGIGLHWCANAILALGGRIWATSDGPGRGASLHLQLPV
jgi:sensor domain CHASE-containing protein/signal transduction histidine kinase